MEYKDEEMAEGRNEDMRKIKSNGCGQGNGKVAKIMIWKTRNVKSEGNEGTKG